MTTETIPVNRHALIRAKAEDLDRVRRYLPSNYHVALNAGIYGEGILIEGHDVAGWTLDAYVLPRLASGLLFGSEVFYCASCASHDHNINDCPNEVSVYAVRVSRDGDYMHVADNLADLKELAGSETSFGQCEHCGSFLAGTDTMTGFSVKPSLPDSSAFHAVCDSCGYRYPIVLKRSKEVCF